MDLAFTAEEEKFRADIRTWLAANLPAGWGTESFPEPQSLEEEVRFLREWQRRLHAARLVGVHWPAAYGGRGASVVENFILQEEMARARAPELIGRIGINLVGPTLIACGSEEQKQLLPRILAAEDIWCQLFSEPNAGSDLTALRCRAEADGDDFVVSGQKTWTSYAQFARWGVLLARTGDLASRGRGISFFLLDMQSSGITIRPLRQMTGSEEFNEVFLDRVRVPRRYLVGEINRGWEIAQTTLSHERGTNPRQMVIHRILLAELLAMAQRRHRGTEIAARDPQLRQKLAQAAIEVQLITLHNWRTLTQVRRHGRPGPESSLVKLFWSEASQRLHDTAMEVLHTYAPLAPGEPRAEARGRWARSYMYYRAGTIFAGTSEIQRNIIAQRVLGLPK